MLITSLAHAPVKRAADVADDSVIAFPRGCAYRRVLERWIGDKDLASVRVLELASYHAIVACVASVPAIAIVPQSVLATVQCGLVAVYSLPKVLSDVSTPLIWRSGEKNFCCRRAARAGAHHVDNRTVSSDFHRGPLTLRDDQRARKGEWGRKVFRQDRSSAF